MRASSPRCSNPNWRRSASRRDWHGMMRSSSLLGAVDGLPLFLSLAVFTCKELCLTHTLRHGLKCGEEEQGRKSKIHDRHGLYCVGYHRGIVNDKRTNGVNHRPSPQSKEPFGSPPRTSMIASSTAFRRVSS